MQAQPPPESQAQIDLAELAPPFDPHPTQIDLVPLRGRARVKRLAQLALLRAGGPALQQIRHLFPAMAHRVVQAGRLAQRGHDLLARSFGGADGSNQRPILVSFTRDRSAITAQEHVGRIRQRPALRQRAVLHYKAF